ncbi:MAG: glycosyltransferase family 4 protein [Gammaproteobacteria bacterium]
MNEARERALLITRNLPPVIGGMERLIGHVVAALASEYETAVVGPRGARLDTPPIAFYDCPLSPPVRFLAVAGRKGWQAAKRHRPQLVFAGSGLTAPIARLAARKSGARYAVYLHGLDIATPHPIYRRFFVPAIRGADLVIANSHYTAGLADLAGVPSARIRILHPGVEIPASVPDHEQAAQAFRARYKLPAGPIILGAGRLTPRKGFTDFVAHGLPAILEAIPEAQFVVAGEVPRHAAQHDGNEAEAIRRAASAAGISEHVHLIGPLDDAGLALAWPATDVHVFPLRDDPRDPEGFGMVALEAAAWGVPTVAFAAGGVRDAIAENESGHLVPPGDYAAFAGATIEALHQRSNSTKRARAVAERHAWPRFDAQLLQLLQTV